MTGCVAAFMARVVGQVSSFNTVFTGRHLGRVRAAGPRNDRTTWRPGVW
ncbi:hypothetical protein [Streptomyces thioluteus]